MEIPDQTAGKIADTQFRNWAPNPVGAHGVRALSKHPSLQTELGKVVRRDRANDLEALRAEFVHGVSGGMPPGEMEVDQVDCLNSDCVQWRMIVNHFPIQVSEITSQFERLRRCKNISGHFDRRIGRQRDLQGTLANHVEHNAAAILFRAVPELPRKITAPVKSVVVGIMFIRFFAVKKHKLNLCSEIWVLRQYATEFQEQTGARAAIICAYKRKGVEDLRIVMGAQQKERRRAPLPRKSRNEIHEANFAAWRVFGERLSAHLPARKPKLAFNVIPRLFDRLGTGGTWTEID